MKRKRKIRQSRGREWPSLKNYHDDDAAFVHFVSVEYLKGNDAFIHSMLQNLQTFGKVS